MVVNVFHRILCLGVIAQGIMVFETTTQYPSTAGVTAADGYCNTAALSTPGVRFYNTSNLAFLSTSTANAPTRFSNYPVYMGDGTFAASSITALLSTSLASRIVDQAGLPTTLQFWTGTTTAGVSTSNCGNWGNMGSSGVVGSSTGAASWVNVGTPSCQACSFFIFCSPTTYNFLCVQTDYAYPGSIATGAHIFQTSALYNGNLGGISGADAICNSAAAGFPALNGRIFRALLATSTATVASRIQPGRALLGLDGVTLGSSVAVASLPYIIATGTSTVPSANFWMGTSTSSCGDWTSASASSGADSTSSIWLTGTPNTIPCSSSRPLVCVESPSPCTVDPCDYTSYCQERGDYFGRTCTCPPNTVGNGLQGKCVNLIFNSFSVSSGATIVSSNSVLLAGTAAGSVFTVVVGVTGTGKNGTGPSNAWTFSMKLTSSSAPMDVPCTTLTNGAISLPASNNNNVALTCTLATGGGSSLAAVVSWCVTFSGFSTQYCSTLTTPVMFNYPPPTITSGTIRRDIYGPGSTSYTATAAGGTIVFEGTNFQPAIMQVYLGQKPSNLQMYKCTLSSVSNITLVFCFPSAGEGSNLVFTVCVGSQCATGTDTYTYPSLPAITGVRGCSTPNGQGTANCPTVGGVTLQIFGTGFTGNLTVLVDMKSCQNAISNSTWISCQCPPGTGVGRSILVTSMNVLSAPQPFISFAPPSVSALSVDSDCIQDRSTNQTLTNCNRMGGARLTITGRNFGSSGATVQIGTVPCLNPSNEGTQDSVVTCTLPPGNFVNQPVTLAVLGGGTITTGSISYTSCPAGSQQDPNNQTSCQLCPKGYSNDQAGRTCTLCETGKYTGSQGQASCTNCPAGSYTGVTGTTSCSQCQVGKYSIVDGQVSCLPCDIGSYTKLTGQQQCTACPQGTYQNSPGMSSCKTCRSGTYSTASGQQSCGPCPLGEYGNGTLPCDQCPEGTFQNVSGTSSCAMCEEGRYSNSPGQVVCLVCDVGYYSRSPGATGCTKCGLGTYMSFTEATVCMNCAPGTYTDTQAQVLCKNCPSGYYTATSGQQTCLPCGKGKYQSNLSSSFCAPCEKGTFSTGTGNAMCQQAPPGTYVPVPGSWNSTDCPQGTSQPLLGQTACDQCDTGRHSPVSGQAACLPCDIGKYGDVKGLTDCPLCPEGTYQPSPGMSICSVCPEGTYSPVEGQQSCAPCELGKYGNGTTPCQLCPGGKFQNVSSQTDCWDCPVGRATNIPGQVACLACEVGYFSNQEGLQTCNKCDKGLYQDIVEATACVACDAGKYTDSEAQFKCKDCTPGFFSNTTGLTMCNPCDFGTYQKASDATQCSRCPVGSFTAYTGQADCQLCEAGTFNTVSGRSTCDQCPVGRIQLSRGESLCNVCDPGKYASTTTICDLCPATSTSTTGICIPCPLGIPASSDRTRCQCQIGSYMDNTAHCVGCAPGLDCSTEGLTANETTTLAGWWRSSKASMSPIKCINVENCDSDDACGPDRTGLLCSICVPGYRSAYFGGPCLKCAHRPTALGNTVGILIAIGLALIAVYILVLRQTKYLEKQLMDATSKDNSADLSAALSANKAKLTKSPSFVANRLSMQSASNGSGSGGSLPPTGSNKQSGILMRAMDTNIPVPGTNDGKPNFISQFKIFVGFLQVLLAIVRSGDLTWPSAFAQMLNGLSFINFDFVPWQSLTCAVPMDGLTQAVVECIVPVFALLIAAPVPLVLRLIDKFDFSDSDENRVRRGIAIRKFTRIFLFTCFLFYPHVSSVVMGVYNCRNVEGVLYLKTDSTILCDSPQWRSRAIPLIVALIVYPFGIPAMCLYLLFKNKRKLNHPGTMLSLGSLYEPYCKDFWYFEVVDMLYKMTMTSLVTFTRSSRQLPLGLGLTGAYLMVVLVADPYKRHADHRLHSFLLADLLVLLVFAVTLQQQGVLTELADALLSAFLITLFILMTAFFIMMVISTMKATVYTWLRSRKNKQAGRGSQMFERSVNSQEGSIRIKGLQRGDSMSVQPNLNASGILNSNSSGILNSNASGNLNSNANGMIHAANINPNASVTGSQFNSNPHTSSGPQHTIVFNPPSPRSLAPSPRSLAPSPPRSLPPSPPHSHLPPTY